MEHKPRYKPLEEIIAECNPDPRFDLDTPIGDFIKIIERETDIPSRLSLLLKRHGNKSWRNFDTMQDLILSYRNGVNWSEKTRGVLNKILTKYGFHELAAKRYARSPK